MTNYFHDFAWDVMKRAAGRCAILVMFAIVSALMASGAEPLACTELEKVPASDLMGYLEKDRKDLSAACIEFSLLRLAALVERLSIADAERTINAAIPFLDFTGTIRPIKPYLANNTVVGATNSVVQRLADENKDPDPVKTARSQQTGWHHRGPLDVGCSCRLCGTSNQSNHGVSTRANGRIASL